MRMTAARPDLGRVAGSLAEQLAWLNSPAAIAGEIARLEEAIGAGAAQRRPWSMARAVAAARELTPSLV